MIKNIRNEFRIVLDEVSWMDQVSKKAAKEKVSFDMNKKFYENSVV